MPDTIPMSPQAIFRKAKMLIVDYDITRYHSFDLLRYQLFIDKDMFMRLKPEYRELVTPGELAVKVNFMRRNMPELNVYDCFRGDNTAQALSDLENQMNVMLKSEAANETLTDINSRFGIVFEKKDVEGVLLQFNDDKHQPSFYDKLTVYKDAHILNTELISAIIDKHKINTILIPSIEFAVVLASHLITIGYTSPLSIIVPNYRYNYMDDRKTLKCMVEMFNLTQKYGYEFGVMDPFSGLTYREQVIRTMEQEEEK